MQRTEIKLKTLNAIRPLPTQAELRREIGKYFGVVRYEGRDYLTTCFITPEAAYQAVIALRHTLKGN